MPDDQKMWEENSSICPFPKDIISIWKDFRSKKALFFLFWISFRVQIKVNDVELNKCEHFDAFLQYTKRVLSIPNLI